VRYRERLLIVSLDMTTIVLDTDFLSSFLKIQRCDLIRSFYLVEQAYIPAAVHREIAPLPVCPQQRPLNRTNVTYTWDLMVRQSSPQVTRPAALWVSRPARTGWCISGHDTSARCGGFL
jgi:hypothetical protein